MQVPTSRRISSWASSSRAGLSVGADEPESAGKEGVLVVLDPVDAGLGPVPQDEPSRIRSCSMASIVPSIRGSSPGRNPTVGMSSSEASTSSVS